MKIKESIDQQDLKNLGYNSNQINTILQCNNPEDFLKYIKPSMAWADLVLLALYYDKGVDFSLFKDKDFTIDQMTELCMQADNLKRKKLPIADLELWANPEYNISNLRRLFLAYLLKEDITKYIDPKLSRTKFQDRLNVVDIMCLAKKEKLDLSFFRDWDLTEEQAAVIYYYLSNKPQIDVSWFADSAFTADQMHIIAKALIDGVDVSWFADPMFSEVQMRALANNLKDGIDVSWFAFPKVDHKTMRLIESAITGGIPEDVVKQVAKECKFDFDKMWDRPELKSVTRIF